VVIFRIFPLALILAVSLAVLQLSASMAGAAPMPVKRQILALYDKAEEGEPVETRIHRAGELPLNHLGYYLHYIDVNSPLPKPADVASQYVAVVTWLTTDPTSSRSYLRWLRAISRLGVKIVIIDRIGSDDTYRDLEIINEIFAPIGLRHTGDYVSTTAGARISRLDPAAYEFERKLGGALPPFEAIWRIEGGPARPILEVELARGGQSRSFALAATGPGGGYAASQYAMRYDPYSDRLAWLLNPFAFFKAALGPDVFPIPDVTTVSGRRLYFSHIDGDGWNNLARMPEHRGKNMRAADVLFEELIKPYPDLPVTVALIAADVLSAEGGDDSAADSARRLFSLPQVEVGSHTCTHPFEWQFFEKYDRELEKQAVSKVEHSSVSRLMATLIEPRSPSAFGAEIADLPRAYFKNPFDLGIEVERAIALTEKLAPPGKRVRTYQWSGNARPFELAVKRTRLRGLRNINGGDTRLDAEYPSVIYVAPIAREVGQERQIYAVNSNENTYTNNWQGPYFGFRNLEHTVRNTEQPRRLKGFNIYYHVYSAERAASLEAVKAMLALARSMQIAPITTSRYAEIADSFFSTTIRRVGDGVWEIGERGAMNTVRFDDADGLDIDYDESRGVLGGNRHNGSLYVALDGAVSTARLAIKPRGEPGKQDHIALVQARWTIRDLRAPSMCQASYQAEGFGDGEFSWQVEPREIYNVAVTRRGASLWNGSAKADQAGRLDISFPNQGAEPVTVALSCQSVEHAVGQ